MISPQRRNEIISALRRGAVPQRSLDAFAVGLERFEPALDEELAGVERGQGTFKAVRGEYGSGKTFVARWLQEKAKKRGFATAEVQISETETPLHRLETIYRRLVERLSTADTPQGALRQILDGWFYALEEDILASGDISEDDQAALLAKTNEMMEMRLSEITRSAPALAAALRAYRHAIAEEDAATAEGLIAWISGQPNVAANIKRMAGIKGDMDHFGALSFLQGLLVILRDSGHPGLLLVLDEVETLQRVRTDVRDKGLNALRQFIDEVDSGRFPGLYLLITGTPAFFEGPQGVQRLAPLAQRLNVDFSTDARFDNPRAVQIRLPGFDLIKLGRVGRNIRDLFAQGAAAQSRIFALADDGYVDDLARAVTGNLGGKVGIAPRIFLRKLVGDVLDRIDQFPDFNPREHYALTLKEHDLTESERNAMAASSVNDIELNL
ncbi:MAG: BREX system ATP-binding protein BrxD [Magnetococcales bacterium]|nr:BREX system ATP-binding protein BrxD [Magnetococcales bacterium]MBF0149118.1 BREX system ATP-binding protein BrxD [Magnetococcales bacterium]MBF0182078.1 BREX system ATP-binding protein BrxD [Magnetococcales bacterium]MBF0632209.1 BREX system ATP-binding protein BrxD [Magnetococcales bacterium]